MQKIHPMLWFDGNAEQAMNFYVSVFKENATINEVTRYGATGPGPKGSVMTASFNLFGQTFTALNGGPQFKFNESISFVISCKDQKETDYYWDKLTEGGEPSACGWVKDRFGLWWQVTPARLIELVSSKDAEKANRVMQAMMKMGKIIIKDLEEAAEGVPAR